MPGRTEQRRQLEVVILNQFESRQGGWVTSRMMAAEIGYPWRAVARALLRLSDRQDIEAQVCEWTSSRSRIRKRHLFIRRAICSDYPDWLMPKPKQEQAKGVTHVC